MPTLMESRRKNSWYLASPTGSVAISNTSNRSTQEAYTEWHNFGVPIYEFRCSSCGAKFSVLVGMTSDSGEIACTNCGAREVQKLVSRVGRFRTEDQRVDEIADRLESMGDPDSPTAVRELVRDVGSAMDEDVSDELEAMFESDMEEDE